jgi:NhaA family Na+:H+ antiporter
VLALLGRSIPGNVRIFLLTLAIVDDIIAVLIIAVFYSAGLDPSGTALAAAGIVAVVIMQGSSISTAPRTHASGRSDLDGALHQRRASDACRGGAGADDASRIVARARARAGRTVGSDTSRERSRRPECAGIRSAGKPMHTPAWRNAISCHRSCGAVGASPWVAYGIMPLFALANAGVPLSGVDFASHQTVWIMLGVALALIVGKPVGVFLTSWLLVRTGLCRLPTGMSWRGVSLVALLAGIGFTMSIFIATLAFSGQGAMDAAKLGVLLGSFVAGCAGLGWGLYASSRGPADVDVGGKNG